MRGQLRSDAVSLTEHSALTSTYIPHQVRYSNVCVVRDEEAAGSNPATPTSSEGSDLHGTGSQPVVGRSTFQEDGRIRTRFLLPPCLT
jgi:hypothetical protein